MKITKKERPDYLGHRSRIRKKFLQSLGEELHDYELLELLLFASITRSDTKPIAKNLLKKFSDISAVINADLNLLKEIDGIGESSLVQIKVISQILKRVLKNRVKERPILNNWNAVLQYVSNSLKDLNYEVFRVLFFDKKHQLIEDELIGIGENDHVVVSAKLIAKKVLLLSASSIVLAHNHPTGDLRPSAADIKVTNDIVKSLSGLDIRVLDHFIISSKGHCSFKEMGLI